MVCAILRNRPSRNVFSPELFLNLLIDTLRVRL